MTGPVLELRAVSKRFGAVSALEAVDFAVTKGEVVGIVGDNGAGKSTLVKCIAGVYAIDAGEYYFEGTRIQTHGPRGVSSMGVATVFQDLALCDNLDVVGNLYLGQETAGILPGAFAVISEVPMEQRAGEVLRSLSVSIPSVRTQVASLSGGQRQSVAVARAVMADAKVVMLDEPTAALGVAQTRQVLDLISRLKDQGLAVVVISHNLADVFEVVDRIVVLRLGKLVGSFDVKDTSQEQVVGAITGAEFGTLRQAEVSE